ncbi:hypothetical protein PAXRUDRAFT_823775 [Paxillus rubicundulus Ve08.2h10]|uniref:Uncharacterized protein n=1 Tax=Paxillus rubicundulus Ve08.2h10 TaxID=930991 RepID=A0A0D0E8I4_9AGAM|nr:hypothetical protein PAXRUDRAFT_823775 [Paxillus rubicundulus Ve08.2h10]
MIMVVTRILLQAVVCTSPRMSLAEGRGFEKRHASALHPSSRQTLTAAQLSMSLSEA